MCGSCRFLPKASLFDVASRLTRKPRTRSSGSQTTTSFKAVRNLLQVRGTLPSSCFLPSSEEGTEEASSELHDSSEYNLKGTLGCLRSWLRQKPGVEAGANSIYTLGPLNAGHAFCLARASQPVSHNPSSCVSPGTRDTSFQSSSSSSSSRLPEQLLHSNCCYTATAQDWLRKTLALLTTLPLPVRDNGVCKKVKQNNEELQEVMALEKKPESKKAEVMGKPKTKVSSKWKPTEGPKRSPAAVRRRKEKAKSRVPKVPQSVGLHTRAQKRKPRVKKPRAVFLKTYHHRIPMMDRKPLDVTDQFVWFEGLPTRIRPPGRRIMCRASTLRCTKRPCTRFCSVSL